MAQIITDLIYSIGSCLSCFPGAPSLQINGRSFKILRLLGEGGFSYVYLVQDTATQELLALKKIRCPFGAESVAHAMGEVDAYRLFSHVQGIIHMVDHAVAKERGGGGGVSGIGTEGAGAADDSYKTVYVLLPYYRRGNLQDMINANLVNHTNFPERRLMLLFLGLCKALRGMHKYSPPVPGMQRMEVGDPEQGVRSAGSSKNGRASSKDKGDGNGNGNGKGKGTQAGASPRGARDGGADDDDDQENEDSQQDDQPLMRDQARIGSDGSIRSYAHRDIKPGNIMIDDSGSTPILMDLGSLAASPVPITSHSQAVATQDHAAEHSTMPYRAPELFDVHTGTVIDTAVDIWSIGCTLFACLVGKSPFEMRSDETGGSLSLCVLGGDWRFPDEGAAGQATAAIRRTNTAKGKEPEGTGAAAHGSNGVSQSIKEVVRKCLKVEAAERPDIDELIDMIEQVIEELPDHDES